jgi:hypothetical protein
VAQIYAEVPVLREIAACESTGSKTGQPRQFLPNGDVLWGNDPKTGQPIKRDVGELQINTWVWGKEAAGMDLDIVNSEHDNVYFGYLLYEKYGEQPWSASEGCWNPSTP